MMPIALGLYSPTASERDFIMTDNEQPTYIDPALASGFAAFESKNFSHAMRLLMSFAEQGNADAQHKVAIMYQNGLGVVASDKEAYKWMKASADQGYPIAQHGLGFMYLEGECVEKNAEEAVKWFQKAADQGLVGSLTTLAMMYEDGRGVEKNPEEAQRLYKLAGF